MPKSDARSDEQRGAGGGNIQGSKAEKIKDLANYYSVPF